MTTKFLKGILIALILFSAPAYASDWKVYIMGIDLDIIKQKDWSMMILGATSSMASHTIGHMAYLDLIDHDYLSDPEGLTPDENRRYGRAGFALQSIIGLALTGFKATRESSFTKGWVIGTDLKLALYHQWHKDWGDFSTIEANGGNMARDYNAFCAIAVYNTLLSF